MPIGYHHLTQYKRCQINALLHRGLSQPEITHPARAKSEYSHHCRQRNRNTVAKKGCGLHGKTSKSASYSCSPRDPSQPGMPASQICEYLYACLSESSSLDKDWVSNC